MTAKILLGAVVLAAIAGSPIAYNHFTSSTGGTQQESETIPQEERRLVSSQTPEKQPVPSVQFLPSAPHEAREKSPQISEKDVTDEVLPPAKPPVEEKGSKPEAIANVKKESQKNDKCGLNGRTTWNGIGTFSKEMHCVRDTAIKTRTPA